MDKELYQKLYHLSLCHRVRFNPDYKMNEIETYINAIGQGNGFYPDEILSMLRHIDTVIPRIYYNDGNPNNGKRLWEIEIGREGSPVIYITVKAKSLGRYHINPGVDTTSMIESCKLAGQRAYADEINYITDEDNSTLGYKTIKFRFWWD